MRVFAGFVALTCLAPPTLAQEPDYDDAFTATCLQDAALAQEKVACIGASSLACLQDGGGSYVERYCFARELSFWDDRLNAVYQTQMAAARADDPLLADRLRDLQRAWIGYRDARCDAVFAAWGEGTGQIPALLECLMRTTAAQTLFLEDGL